MPDQLRSSGRDDRERIENQNSTQVPYVVAAHITGEYKGTELPTVGIDDEKDAKDTDAKKDAGKDDAAKKADASKSGDAKKDDAAKPNDAVKKDDLAKKDAAAAKGKTEGSTDTESAKKKPVSRVHSFSARSSIGFERSTVFSSGSRLTRRGPGSSSSAAFTATR